MRYVKPAVLMIGAFVVGFMAIRAVGVFRSDRDLSTIPAVDSLAAAGGTELVLIYIGRSTCGWCRHPDLPGLVERAALDLRKEADRRGAVLTTLGVSVDRLPLPGLEHLAHVFEFDAVASGGSWTGYVSGSLLWSRAAGEAATPQLMVLERRLSRIVGGSSTVSYSLDDERMLSAKSGLRDIRKWVQTGTPLPRIVSAVASEP